MQRAWWMLLGLVLCWLAGCRAMETHDIDGTRYDNEDRPFYANAKRGDLQRRSYATAWRSGDLQGECDRRQPVQASEGAVHDSIDLRATALFDTDSAALSEAGRAVLDQLLLRIAKYRGVQRLSLAGHADRRGDAAYNVALSRRRNDAVEAHLRGAWSLEPIDGMPEIGMPDIVSTPYGESRPVTPQQRGARLDADRRVEVTVQARSVDPSHLDRTLCQPTGHPRGRLTNPGDAYGEPARRLHTVHGFAGPLPVSTGDRLRLSVAGDTDFDGIYEVGAGGAIALPYLDSLVVSGLTAPAIQAVLADRLVERRLFRRELVTVTTVVQQWAAVDVYLQGAVFNPGRRTINGRDVELRAFNQTQRSGDGARNRMLSVALASAGGVRPDADLSRIEVVRAGESVRVDLGGIVSGEPTGDFPLIDGDRITVPSTGHFQDELVRVSQITPPGIRVFLSNLSTPSPSNSLSAIDRDATSLPYGTRLLRGLVSANCVGGVQHTNSARRAVLISTNPLSGRTEVIERNIQQLISDPERDDINPYLMPNDGIACYDSEVTNLRDIARTVTDVLSPFIGLRVLFGD